MKIYTEEQVKKIYSIAHKTGDSGYAESFDFDTKELSITPIELPSDKEIEEYNDGSTKLNPRTYYDAFQDGAKWMKEQILKQNK